MLEAMRQWGSSLLEYGRGRWQRWREAHPQLMMWLRKAYILLAWILIPLVLLAWIFIPQARQALIQFLWSYYLLWQFWFLARSKTMTWTGTARFFVVGAWLIAPLSVLIIYFVHVLFDEGAASVQADWSREVLGPIVEETVKLLPFFFLFLFTRRTRTFSLTDYLLAGAAVGVGFDFMEEMLRRWVVADIDGGLLGLLVNLLHNTKQNWSLFTLFPGSFESGGAISPGHGIWTGFVTLAIGLGVRYRQRWGNKVFLLPLFIFAWAVFDHGAWNAHYGGMPLLAELLYLLTGQGHFFKWLFLFAFLLAIILDYRQLNRVRGSLPLLPGERLLEPVTELFTLLQSFFRGCQAWGHMLLFTRERRQLGFSVLKPLGEETKKEEEALREKLQQRFLLLGSLFALLLLIGVTAASIPSEGMEAYFAGLFDRLADWWQGLTGWEKAGVITAVTVLGGLLMVASGGGILAGGFTALSIALTAQDLLENRAQTKAFLEDPVGTLKQWGKELLQRPPQEAAILLLSVAITRRIPVFRALDELVSGAKESLQRFAKKAATKKKVSTGTGSSPDGSQSTGGGSGKEPDKKKTGWQRFEEEKPLPGSIGGSETKSLFTQVQKVAYKEDPGRRTTFGMPDDIVVRDGRITIVEEAKMYSKRDFELLAELARENPRRFVDVGRVPDTTDVRERRYIQFKKHKESVDYLLSNLDRIPKAKELGITHSDARVEYMLKVPKWVSEESLETMKRAFEKELKIAVKYRRIDWGGGKG